MEITLSYVFVNIFSCDCRILFLQITEESHALVINILFASINSCDSTKIKKIGDFLPIFSCSHGWFLQARTHLVII